MSMTHEQLASRVRALTIYAAVLSVLFFALAVFIFLEVRRSTNSNAKFTQIDVQRINILERDGDLKMVISNGALQHPGIIDGKTLSRKRPPGLIFFNEMGDECGGLVYQGSDSSGKRAADAQLSFDKIRNDQTIAIRHLEGEGENGRYLAALQVWDQPNTSLGPVIEKMAAIEKMSDGPEKSAAENELRAMPHGVERVTVGRDRDSVAMLRLSDGEGRARIKLWVDASGTAKLEFFDEAGQVTRSFP
jgi:hypothetical protein